LKPRFFGHTSEVTNASDRAGTGPSPALCPLCGQSNACGQLAGASECWCMTTKIAAAALEAVPIEMRNRACICQACARKAAAGTVGA
jgi:hypothetical protein